MKNKIIDILKEKYDITDDIKNRVDQLLECMQDDNQFNSLNEILNWLNNRIDDLDAEVNVVNFNDCDDWTSEKETGNIEHSSGGFFKIIGVETKTNVRESGEGWRQPMIDQGTESSIVGLIKKNFNGIPHYLVDAKFEPGNYGKIQLSPTLQCTYDNLNKLHNGRRPKYAEYFNGEKDVKVLFEHWYPEDGGRFYLKRVKNMIIETDCDIEHSDSHIWITMYQLKQLLKRDNIINAHIRSIMSYL
jgi:oxidase EvaA